jgi:hypothetical protein
MIRDGRQERTSVNMAKNIERIAAGLGTKVVARLPHTGGARSAPRGWPGSSPTSKPASSRGRASARAGRPMRAGCGIPRCR